MIAAKIAATLAANYYANEAKNSPARNGSRQDDDAWTPTSRHNPEHLRHANCL
jgi:hypothetical protein